jgi:hypothetical protein
MCYVFMCVCYVYVYVSARFTDTIKPYYIREISQTVFCWFFLKQ